MKKFNKKRIITFMLLALMMVTLAVPSFATSTTGTMESAITDVGTALTGVLGYLSNVTSGLLSNDLWLLGMGFFVIAFIAGFVMYLFRAGRR